MFDMVVSNAEGIVIDHFVMTYERVLRCLTAITDVYGDDVSVKISKTTIETIDLSKNI